MTEIERAAPDSPDASRCICGNPLPARRTGPGRTARYCSQACRQAAYRRRQVPDTADLRSHVTALLDHLDGAVVPSLRGTLGRADSPTLAKLARSLRTVIVVADRITPRETVTEPSVTHHPPEQPNTRPEQLAPARAKRRTTIGGLVPTDEQAAIIDACVAGDNLVIVAGAGTGKTSTLRMASTELGRRGLYVAYNRAIADEARAAFPPHVTCTTAHALAYRAIGYAYRPRLKAARQPARTTASLLAITQGVAVDNGLVIPPAQLARLALETVTRYSHTADREPSARHVPAVTGVDGPARQALAEAVLPLAVRAWSDICDARGGRLRVEHDHYLKLWSLTEPRLDADYILYDEAQDADPVIASVVQAQDAQLIAVGDSCQAIYGWRGAVDALANWPADRQLRLSQSWRFGPAIADEANKWLAILRADLRLTGSPHVASTVRPLGAPSAILCRTNAEALRQAMAAMDAGRRTALVGGATAIRQMARAALDLQSGRRTDHPELWTFGSWEAVREYVNTDDAAADLAVFVRLVDEHGAATLIGAAERLTDEQRGHDVIVSTAHKAKGREWTAVRVGDDFREPPAKPDGSPGAIPAAAAMLAYVSVTRAKRALDRGGLSWIDRYATASHPPA